eukprot:4741051-Pyramimonas_sp.AAC.2
MMHTIDLLTHSSMYVYDPLKHGYDPPKHAYDPLKHVHDPLKHVSYCCSILGTPVLLDYLMMCTPEQYGAMKVTLRGVGLLALHRGIKGVYASGIASVISSVISS